MLYQLQQKHSVDNLQDLIEIKNVLDAKINSTLNLDEQINNFEKEAIQLKNTVSEIANKIHHQRISVIPKLKIKLEKFLEALGLPNAQFKFEISSTPNFRNNGTDSLSLLFTANKGSDFGSLKKVASGGELSRIMLAIKAVLAQFKTLPTLILDEIDSGVSGEIANMISEILYKMSGTMQIICITHLPQLAGKGDQHIKIFKEDINEITVTKVKPLTSAERIEEIAEMIEGKNRTEATILYAKQLLN
jgi:DNA repair protein RecN (Recombination protein N)